MEDSDTLNESDLQLLVKLCGFIYDDSDSRNIFMMDAGVEEGDLEDLYKKIKRLSRLHLLT